MRVPCFEFLGDVLTGPNKERCLDSVFNWVHRYGLANRCQTREQFDQILYGDGKILRYDHGSIRGENIGVGTHIIHVCRNIFDEYKKRFRWENDWRKYKMERIKHLKQMAKK